MGNMFLRGNEIVPYYNYQRNGIIGGAYPKDYFDSGIKTLHDYSSPDIVKNNLQLYVDAANKNSYPGSGTTWFDLSGNRRNGTLTSGLTFSENDGGYIESDGVDDYINFGNQFSFTTESFALGGWFSCRNFDTTGTPSPGNNINQAGAPLFWKGTRLNRGYYAHINLTTGQFLFASTSSGPAVQQTVSSGIYTRWNQFNHVLFVRNGTSVKIYLNGVDITGNAGSHSTLISSTEQFRMSAYSITAFSNIRWGSFAIWSRASGDVLSDLEIKKMYNAGRKRYGVFYP